MSNEFEDRKPTPVERIRQTKAVYAELNFSRDDMLRLTDGLEGSEFDIQIGRDVLFDRVTGMRVHIRYNLDALEDALEDMSNKELIAVAEHYPDQKMPYVLSQRLKACVEALEVKETLATMKEKEDAKHAVNEYDPYTDIQERLRSDYGIVLPRKTVKEICLGLAYGMASSNQLRNHMNEVIEQVKTLKGGDTNGE